MTVRDRQTGLLWQYHAMHCSASCSKVIRLLSHTLREMVCHPHARTCQCMNQMLESWCSLKVTGNGTIQHINSTSY